MKSSWTVAIVAWSIILVVVLICLVPELNKTPEEREAERERIRNRTKEIRQKDQEKREANRSNDGCFAEFAKSVFIGIFLLVVLTFTILVFAIPD